MSTFALFLVALGSAFAVVLAIRAHGDVDEVLRELRQVKAKLATTEADLSTLRRRLETLRLEWAETEHFDPKPDDDVRAPELRADPRVYVQRVPDQPHDRVILSNRSSAAAHDLTLELDCPDGVTPFLPEFAEGNFPVEVLQQGVPYIVLASFRDRCRPPVDARLEWRDPDGRRQVREFPLRW